MLKDYTLVSDAVRMLPRLKRTATTTLVIIILCFLQVLHYSGEAAPAAGWKDWLSTNTGETGEIARYPIPKFARPDAVPEMGPNVESWSLEIETLPDVVVPTHTSAVSVEAAAMEPLESEILPVLLVPTHTSAAPTKAAVKSQETTKEEKEEKEKCTSNTAWAAQPLPDLNTTFNVPSDIVYSSAGPKPHEIVILTASDGKGHNGGIMDILEKTAANRESYCAYHGYNYHFVNISKFNLRDAHPVWKKIPAIVDAFNTYPESQWIFFLDLDAIIMSPKQDLNSLTLSHAGMQQSLAFGQEFTASERRPLGVFMPQIADANLNDIDMLIAQDQNGINAGSFFLRRSKFTQWLLDMWADPFFMYMDWPGQEQETLLHFIKHHRMFRKHVGLLKQRVANAYPEGGEEMSWQDKDLIVHLAGCWVEDECEERWQKFWNQRGTV